jgi:hypothetical protein
MPTPISQRHCREGEAVKIAPKLEKTGEAEMMLPVEAADAVGPVHIHGG